MSGLERAASVLRGGAVLRRAWWAGSLVMTRWTCTCIGRSVRGGWTLLRTDAEATRVKQTAADRKAAALAEKRRKALAAKESAAGGGGEEKPEAAEEEVKAPPVDPVRRSASEALVLAAIGATAVSGLGGAAWGMALEQLSLLAPWRPWVITGAVAAWSVAAIMLAPPLAAAEEQVDVEGPAPDGGAPAAEASPAADEEFVDLADAAAVVHKVAAANGHTDAHLADILPDPLFAGWELSDLKAAFEAEWQVPTKEFKLRFKQDGGRVRERVRLGVRWADVEAALGGAPAAPATPPAPAVPVPPAEAPSEAPVKPSVEAPVPGLYLVRSGPLPETSTTPRTVAG